MADLSVIKEYLVRLGFEADNAQYARVQQVLDRLSFTVQQHTSGIAKTFVGMGIAVTGVYAAIGTATLTMMEKVARADLGYQLYAQQMYLSVGAARQLKIATDALGYSLDEIAWNPELRARLGELIRIQNVMGKGVLGGDFEASMKGIRDITFEFTKFKTELQYGAMGIAESLFKAFGGQGNVLATLQRWNDWIATHLPEIRDKIVQYLVPVLQDAYAIFRDIGAILYDITVGIGDFLGQLMGTDTKKSTDSFSRLADALVNISHAFRWAADELQHFEKCLTIILGMITGGAVGALLGLLIAGPAGAAVGWQIGAALGTVGGAGVAGKMGREPNASVSPSAPPGSSASSLADQARQIAKDIAAKTGARADFIFAQMAYETGNFTNRGATQLNNLAGITNPGGAGYQSFASLDDFKQRFQQVLSLPGYRGVFEAKTQQDYLASLKRGGYAQLPYNPQGFARAAAGYGGGDTNIGTINITIPPGTTEETAKRIVISSIQAERERNGKRIARTIPEGAGAFS